MPDFILYGRHALERNRTVKGHLYGRCRAKLRGESLRMPLRRRIKSVSSGKFQLSMRGLPNWAHNGWKAGDKSRIKARSAELHRQTPKAHQSLSAASAAKPGDWWCQKH
jgi:hypothetical protein